MIFLWKKWNIDQFLLTATRIRTATIKTTIPRIQRSSFSFDASCSYSLASTSSFLATWNFILACLILSAAMLSFCPIPSTSREVSSAICLITPISFSISISSWSYSCNSFIRIDSPSYLVSWICLCFFPTGSSCDSLRWSSFMDSSFLSISSMENDYKNYLSLFFSLLILSVFSWISIKLFCFSMRDECYFWNYRIFDAKILLSEIIIYVFSFVSVSIDA